MAKIQRTISDCPISDYPICDCPISDIRQLDNRKSDIEQSEIDILKLIPQRPPFVMVDKLLFCDEIKTLTSFHIKKDNILNINNYFSETGILENIAQTCALRLGYLGKGKPVKIGMIGSINDFEVNYLPNIGDIIETEMIVEHEIFNVILLKANVSCNNKTVATCGMKVVLTDIDSEVEE